MKDVTLVPLAPSDREQFIKDNQDTFRFGALEEFGLRDDHIDEDGEIISGSIIGQSIDEGAAYRILQHGKPVGGVVIRTQFDRGELELLFTDPSVHSSGIGYAAWCAIEEMYPQVAVWETFTPYFEKRNIHFYVNRCGFRIVEFFNEHHCDPQEQEDAQFDMFRFEKQLPASPEAVREQIRRVTYFEDIMQQAAQMLETEKGADAPSPALTELRRQLTEYYGSDAWDRDYAADETGLLPENLHRGVLSEDGLWNLLEALDETFPQRDPAES